MHSTDEQGRREAGPTDTNAAAAEQAERSAATVADLDDIRPAALKTWASACWHLAARGLPPLPPEHVRRALRRRGWWHR